MRDGGVDIYLFHNTVSSGRAGTMSNTSFIILYNTCKGLSSQCMLCAWRVLLSSSEILKFVIGLNGMQALDLGCRLQEVQDHTIF